MTEIDIDERAYLVDVLEKTLHVLERIYRDSGISDNVHLDNIRSLIEHIRKERQLYNTETAAEKAKTTPNNIRKAIERNQLQAQFLGAQYVITEDALNAWMASRRKPGRPKSR